MNLFKFDEARNQINLQLQKAKLSNNIGMQLDNAFLEFELRLAQKDTLNFKQEWQERTQLIKDMGFERYQVYMDFYLARYYKQIGNNKQAIQIISKVSENAKNNNDIKILVDAQNQLAEIYTQTEPQTALDILKSIEQYKPDANPYLELKALALNKLGRKIEALNLLYQAKLVFHEAWKAENQLLLEQLEKEINHK
jgi:tetratricopeptide (TPR) repeat protein